MRQPDSRRGGALFVFLTLLAVYQWDSTFLFFTDTEVNAYGAVSVVERSELLLSPELTPWTLVWEATGPKGTAPVEIQEYSDLVDDLRKSGALRIADETYLVRRSVFPDRYVNTFGFGVSLSAVPVFAAIKPWLADPQTRRAAVWYGGKFAASTFVAGSAAFVFLAALRFVSAPYALLAAFAYGLGTSVWAVSSQALWQHAPSEFSLAVGAYALVRRRDGWAFPALCGAAFAWATWCRHPSAVVVLAAGGYFLLVDRKALAAYLLAGAPFAAGMFALNAWCYGSPFHFGELLVPHLAAETTGRPAIWQTPAWLGLTGMLLSPSRGMFVYSPFLLFAAWGAWRSWRDPDLETLRPLTVAVGALWIVHAVYFDWWGGYSYGYRQIVDSATLLAILLAPVLPRVLARRRPAIPFSACLAWSVAVQAVGAWAFDIHGWNDRRAVVAEDESGERIVRLLEFSEAEKWTPAEGSSERLVSLSIDQPSNRRRLWSIADNQIAYYMANYRAARRLRLAASSHFSRPTSERLKETYVNLYGSLRAVGRLDEARLAHDRLEALAKEELRE
jgi:hypothetical protein